MDNGAGTANAEAIALEKSPLVRHSSRHSSNDPASGRNLFVPVHRSGLVSVPDVVANIRSDRLWSRGTPYLIVIIRYGVPRAQVDPRRRGDCA